MKKRFFALAMALVMVLSMSTIFTAVAEEPITINMVTNFLGNNCPDSNETNFMYQTILEKTGVAMNMVYLDEYDTAINTRLIGEDIPDMFIVSPDQLQTYAGMGYLLPLDEYKETGLKCVFEKMGYDTDIPSLYYNGEMYGIPAAKAISDYYYLILVRKDWNEKYNLKTPTTVDELYDYCTWLANNDPDGNGIKDTIGFTGFGVNGLAAITAPYGVTLGNHILIEDGKVTHSVLQPRMVEALTMLKKFYDANLLDPDIFSNSTVKANTIACNVGVSAMPWSNILKANYVAQYKGVNPDAEYTWIPALSQGGDPAYTIAKHDKYVGDKWVISADISEEKLNAIFKVLEYMTTDEGLMLTYMGIENVHWKRDEQGKVAIIPEKSAEANFTNMWQILGRYDAMYLEAKFPEAGEATAFGLQTPIIETFNSSVIVPEDFTMLKDMEDYIKTQLIAFFKGERDLAEYDKFVEELRTAYSFDEYMGFATEQLVALGLANE